MAREKPDGYWDIGYIRVSLHRGDLAEREPTKFGGKFNTLGDTLRMSVRLWANPNGDRNLRQLRYGGQGRAFDTPQLTGTGEG